MSQVARRKPVQPITIDYTVHTPEEREGNPSLAVGKGTCPICGHENVTVVSDSGYHDENPDQYYYLGTHFVDGSERMCPASETIFHQFVGERAAYFASQHTDTCECYVCRLFHFER